jgi:hypothetical protein
VVAEVINATVARAAVSTSSSRSLMFYTANIMNAQSQRIGYSDVVTKTTSSVTASVQSCTKWSRFASSMTVDVMKNDVAAVELSAFSSFPTVVNKAVVAASSIRCDSPSGVATLISALVSSSANVTVSCLDSVRNKVFDWKVTVCGSAVSSVYVNATNHNMKYLLSTCQGSCSVAADSQPALALLSVTLTPKVFPPSIAAIASSPRRTSISLNASLIFSSGLMTSYMACAVLPTAPTSIYDILSAATGTWTSTPTASVVILNLNPYTVYTAYCLTMSSTSVYSSLSSAIATKMTTTTLCCKAVVATLLINSAYVGVPVKNAFQVTLSSLPTSSVTVSLVAAKNGVLISGAIFPANVTFTTLSASLVAQFSLSSFGASKTISLMAYVNGTSAGEFGSSVTFTSSLNTVAIVAQSSTLSAPSAVSAQFDNSGVFVIVSFSAPIAFIASLSLTNSWSSCAGIVSFRYSNASRCQLSPDMLSISIQPNVKAKLIPGDTISVRGGVIGASCSKGSSCTTSVSSVVAATSLALKTSSSPPIPTVLISAPSVLGVGCASDNYTMDITQSTGSAGRSWDSVFFQVVSLDSSASVIETFLNSDYALFPPTAIPGSLFTASYSYVITAKVCNFLGGCGSASQQLAVVNSVLPTVSFVGSSQQSIYRNASYFIAANGVLSSCISEYSTSCAWSVADAVTGTAVSTSSIAKDPLTLLLPAYSLLSSKIYTVTVTYSAISNTDTTKVVSAQAVGLVAVLQAPVVALIAGGDMVTVRKGYAMVLDGSGSFDQDLPNKGSAGLSYRWSCSQIEPSYSDVCGFSFNASTAAKSSLSLSTGSDSVVTSAFVLTVTGSNNRVAKASVTVTVIAESAPVINFQTPESRLIVTSNPFALYASVTFNSTSSAFCVWSTGNAALVMGNSSLTSAVLRYEPSAALASWSPKTLRTNVAFGPNSLPNRGQVTFALSCSLIGDSSAASAMSVTFTTVSSPTPGALSITPTSGTELTTTFAFMAQHWTDDYLPLQYSFGFVDAVHMRQSVLAPKSYIGLVGTQLSAGITANEFAVTCFVAVFNAYGANATMYESVVVVELQVSDETLTTSLATALDTASTNAAVLVQTLTLYSSAYNRVNCSAAPNCTQLFRSSCFGVSNTCGPCLNSGANKYVGVPGNSNKACVPLAAARSRASTGSSTSRPCNSSSVCSGHGVCYFANTTTGLTVNTCPIDSSSCDTSCTCDSGFIGLDCSTTVAGLALRRSARQQMLTSFASLVNLQNADSFTVASWTSTLLAITQNTLELSSDASMVAVDLVSEIVTNAADSGISLSASSVNNLLSVLDNVATTITYVTSYSGNLTNLVATALTESMLPLITNQMVGGQGSSSAVWTNFRVISSLASSVASVSLDLPQTTTESLTDSLTASLFAPASDLSSGASSYVAMNIVLLKQSVFGIESLTSVDTSALQSASANATSGPTHLQIQLDEVCLSSNDFNYTVTFTLPHNSKQSFVSTDEIAIQLSQQSAENSVIVQCKHGRGGNFSVYCANVGQNVSYYCDGIWDSNLTIVCPVTYSYAAPSCVLAVNSVSSSNDDLLLSAACTVIKHSGWETVCGCNLCYNYNVSNEARRRLITGMEIASVMATSVITSATDFAAVLTNPSSLTTASQVFYVIRVLGMFVGLWIGLPALWYASNSWRRMKRKANKQNKRRKSVGNFIEAPSRANAAVVLVDYATSILPEMYSNKSVAQRCWHELTEKVPFLIILFGNNRRFKSYHLPIILFKLLTTLTYCLFALSFFFSLQYPTDDGSCSKFVTEGSCSAAKSQFDKSVSTCQWKNDTTTATACEMGAPEYSSYMNIIMCILVVVATTPILFVLERLFNEILLAPTATELDGMGHVVKGTSDAANIGTAAATAVKNAVSTVRRVSINTANNVRTAISKNKQEKQKREGREYKLMDRNIVLPADVIQHRYTAVQVCNDIPVFRKLAASMKERSEREDGRHASRQDVDDQESKSKDARDSQVVPDPSSTPSAKTRESFITRRMRTNNQHLLEGFWYRFMHDLRLTRKQLHRAADLQAFDEAWGIQSVSNDGELITLCPAAKEAIQREHVHAQSVGVVALASMKKLPRSMSGAELMKLFFMDMMGNSTIQARILKATVSEGVLTKKRVVTWGMKCSVIAGLVIVNLFFVYSCLLYAADRDLGWQYAWLWNAMINIAVELILGPCFEAFVLDCLIPGTIADEVEVAKVEVTRQVQRLCHPARNSITGTPLLVDRPFPDLQSKYFYCSRVVAEKRSDLMESALVHGFETKFPFVSQHTLDRIHSSYQHGDGTGSVLTTARSWTFNSIGVTVLLTTLLKQLGTFPVPLQRFVMQLIQPIYIAVFGFGFNYLNRKLGTVSTLLVVIIFLLLLLIAMGYMLHGLLKGSSRADPKTTGKSAVVPTASCGASVAKSENIGDDDPAMFLYNAKDAAEKESDRPKGANSAGSKHSSEIRSKHSPREERNNRARTRSRSRSRASSYDESSYDGGEDADGDDGGHHTDRNEDGSNHSDHHEALRKHARSEPHGHGHHSHHHQHHRAPKSKAHQSDPSYQEDQPKSKPVVQLNHPPRLHIVQTENLCSDSPFATMRKSPAPEDPLHNSNDGDQQGNITERSAFSDAVSAYSSTDVPIRTRGLVKSSSIQPAGTVEHDNDNDEDEHADADVDSIPLDGPDDAEGVSDTWSQWSNETNPANAEETKDRQLEGEREGEREQQDVTPSRTGIVSASATTFTDVGLHSDSERSKSPSPLRARSRTRTTSDISYDGMAISPRDIKDDDDDDDDSYIDDDDSDVDIDEFYEMNRDEADISTSRYHHSFQGAEEYSGDDDNEDSDSSYMSTGDEDSDHRRDNDDSVSENSSENSSLWN